ncbi:MAG: heme-binding protein [Mycolicibacterium sp.]|uniref:heme-binding protein n=1 Tax=Mycolicibacterium sp. TaxID=2320850 RepID=UPI003D0D620A
MFFSAPTVRRAVVGGLGGGALAGAMLLGALPTAAAQPQPPNCTAADFSGVAAGVSAASSTYLFTHPEVNAFFTDLHGDPPEKVESDVDAYLVANPQVFAELTAIRQPLVDLRNRCGIIIAPDEN